MLITFSTTLHLIYAPAAGPPEVAVLMICKSDDPTTTKMKNPSITGPTAKPSLAFCLAWISTSPRLWMFLLYLLLLAFITRLETP